jgi:large subunit ribosomal protein L30
MAEETKREAEEKGKQPKRVVKQAKTVKVTKPVSSVSNKSSVSESEGRIALMLIRGLTGTKGDIRNTLYALCLRKKHVCVVIPDIPSNRMAAIKCKDYLTFGEINDETYQALVKARGRRNSKGELKKFFALHPPRGGFERKGIKNPFSKGGALGYRGTKINDLIRKML